MHPFFPKPFLPSLLWKKHTPLVSSVNSLTLRFRLPMPYPLRSILCSIHRFGTDISVLCCRSANTGMWSYRFQRQWIVISVIIHRFASFFSVEVISVFFCSRCTEPYAPHESVFRKEALQNALFSALRCNSCQKEKPLHYQETSLYLSNNLALLKLPE